MQPVAMCYEPSWLLMNILNGEVRPGSATDSVSVCTSFLGLQITGSIAQVSEPLGRGRHGSGYSSNCLKICIIQVHLIPFTCGKIIKCIYNDDPRSSEKSRERSTSYLYQWSVFSCIPVTLGAKSIRKIYIKYDLENRNRDQKLCRGEGK